ncbi:hypothetical protein D3C75_1046320 [compost metagenome]
MVDDAGMQAAVVLVLVTYVHRGQDLAAGPRPLALDHQHGTRALAQQLPVAGGEQGLFQRVVRAVFLDHQLAALGLLHVDDGVVQVVAPGLFMGDVVVPVIMQLAAQQAQQRAVVMPFVTHQQVQARAGEAGDQLGPGQRPAVGVLGVEDDEDAADGLHGR